MVDKGSKKFKNWDISLPYVIIIAVSLRISTFAIQRMDEWSDMKVQRGWMRLTLNLPLSQWYDTSILPDYWKIDYPPLTAWHQYLCGLIGSLIDPASMMLESDQIIKSYAEIAYMRSTVLLTDLIVTIPSLIAMFNILFYNLDAKTKNWALLSILMSSQVIFIDYVKFQYNIFTISLVVIATAYTLNGRFCMSAMFFGLAVNYKLYALYFSMPFPVYWTLCAMQKAKKEPKAFFYLEVLLELFKICLTGIIICIIIWIPWININDFSNMLEKIIPLKRPYVEEKVGNLWYVLSTVYKIENDFSNNSIALLCMVFTLVGCLPFLYYLYKKPSQSVFIHSICGCSLSFFLFAYLVHSKSIMYTSTFINFILIIDYPDFFQVLTIIGSFNSYVPYYRRDYFIYQLIYFCVTSYYIYFVRGTYIKRHNQIVLIGIAFIHFLELFQPKNKYLNLHSRLIALYSFGYFAFCITGCLETRSG